MVDGGAQAIEGRPSWHQDFVRFAVEIGVLRFGEFKTKAGRMSPYFFNAGLFDDGAKMGRPGRILCKSPARPAAWNSTWFLAPPTRAFRWPPPVAGGAGPPGRDVPFAYNRKEAKDHGEGGTLVGAPLQGRVLDR